MRELTFEDADKLWWSNELLRFAISVKLLLFTYLHRPEAEPFRHNKLKLEEACLESIGDFPSFAAKLRTTLPKANFGVSRRESDQTMVKFKVASISSGVIVSLKLLFTSSGIANMLDKDMRHSQRHLLAFRKRYQNEFAQRRLGGTWIPNKIYFGAILSGLAKGIDLSRQLFDDRMQPLLTYKRRLTNLCYKAGLKCWWAANILFGEDQSRWAGPIPTDELGHLNLDALLGLVFPREMIDLFKASDERKTAEHIYHEWEILSMSDDEMRKVLGVENSQIAHQIFEDWGYSHGFKWRQRDFDMLFDRLYLHESIEDITSPS